MSLNSRRPDAPAALAKDETTANATASHGAITDTLGADFTLRPPGPADANTLFGLVAQHDLRWPLVTRFASVLTPHVALTVLQNAAEVGYVVEHTDGRFAGLVGLIDGDVVGGVVSLDGVSTDDVDSVRCVRAAVRRVLDEAEAAGTVRRVYHEAYDELGPPIIADHFGLWEREVSIPNYVRINGSWCTRTTYTLRMSRWIREKDSPSASMPWVKPAPNAAPASAPSTFPPTPPHASRVRLRPLSGEDYPALRDLETAPDVLHSWRLRGQLPATAADYERGLWHGMADQRIIENLTTGEMIGLVQMYNLDLRLRQGWFSVIVNPSRRSWGVAFEGVALFLWRLFTDWDLRRVYFLSIGDNFTSFASLESRSGYHVYGKLKDRTYLAGELTDVVIGGVDRDEWMTGHGAQLIRKAKRVAERNAKG